MPNPAIKTLMTADILATKLQPSSEKLHVVRQYIFTSQSKAVKLMTWRLLLASDLSLWSWDRKCHAEQRTIETWSTFDTQWGWHSKFVPYLHFCTIMNVYKYTANNHDNNQLQKKRNKALELSLGSLPRFILTFQGLRSTGPEFHQAYSREKTGIKTSPPLTVGHARLYGWPQFTVLALRAAY